LERIINEQRSREHQLQTEREAMNRLRMGEGDLAAESAVTARIGETK
jgi:hypothetical protein